MCVKGLVKGPVYVIEYDCDRVTDQWIEHLYSELKTEGISFVLVPTVGGSSIHIHEPQQVAAK